jgi:hypothetical protein
MGKNKDKTKDKKANKFYYSTYSNDIYAISEHQEKHSSHRKDEGKYIKRNKKHWSLNILFNVRNIVVVASIVLGSGLFASMISNEPKNHTFQVGMVIAPPGVFFIKGLQIPEAGSIVNKRVIFEALIKTIKDKKNADLFTDSQKYYSNIKIKRGIQVGETVDSLRLTLEMQKPDLAQQWVRGYLAFSARNTINRFIRNSQKKIDDKKDQIRLKIDNAYKQVKDENKAILKKISRYRQAIKKAKALGIVKLASVESIPKNKRSEDSLYLQGYWGLENEVSRLELIFDKQLVNVDREQQELKDLEGLYPKFENLSAFSLEKNLELKNLNPAGSRQLVWSVIGAVIGLIFGLIASYPFRRKK